ncbi:hypothetical protein [Sphingomicrobium nitratireducens]|uniref:hypothetical protein n=1 Tax=Sphingomicrobium nitratireducens TaxID=2964666 RepID=UPI00224073F5|nr:hypothetical protein [Sphingomicrobium nitratireducens]
MHRREIEGLDPRRTYWVPAVTAPQRDWAASPGCRKGARFLVDRRSLGPSRERFPTFDSRVEGLQWVMRHRAELMRNLDGAEVRVVELDRWLLGLDQLAH